MIMKLSLRNWFVTLALLILTVSTGIVFLVDSDIQAAGQSGSYQITSPVGTEQVQVNSAASAYNNYVLLNTVRNTTGYCTQGAAASPTVTLATSCNNLIITGAVTGTMTLNMPAAPYDAELVSVNTTGAAASTVAALTVNGNGASLSVAVSGNTGFSTAGVKSFEWQYSAATTTWYQLR
jgi:hypothetical protein